MNSTLLKNKTLLPPVKIAEMLFNHAYMRKLLITLQR